MELGGELALILDGEPYCEPKDGLPGSIFAPPPFIPLNRAAVSGLNSTGDRG